MAQEEAVADRTEAQSLAKVGVLCREAQRELAQEKTELAKQVRAKARAAARR